MPNKVLGDQKSFLGPPKTQKLIFSKNKPKMAYSRDLPKLARQQCGINDYGLKQDPRLQGRAPGFRRGGVTG